MKLSPKFCVVLAVPMLLAACQQKSGNSTGSTGSAAGTPGPGTPAPEITPEAPYAGVESPAGTTTITSAITTPPARPAPAADYDIDPVHSRLGFSVRHMMVSNVNGELTKWTGHVRVDEASPAASNVALDIDPSSVDTHEPKRDADLRSPNFFDVAKFPKMSFTSTSIERAGATANDGYKVTGDLTIRDVTKPVTLDVEPLSPETKDPMGNVRRGTHVTGKINRREFGLTYDKRLDNGGVLVGDQVKLDIDVEMVKKAAK